MNDIYEIAPDVFRLSIFVPEINLQFNHFIVRDDEPLLFHTGSRAMFPALKEMVAKVIDPTKIRWIGFSHFETDECGSLNQWLAIAPNATAVHGMIGCLVNLNDFADRMPRLLAPDEKLTTGKFSYRFVHTPQLPHGWDAGVLFEEKQKTLFCSDLCHQEGQVEPLTKDDLMDRCRQVLTAYQASPLANYVPYTQHTGRMLRDLAKFEPQTLAIMHGSSFSGNGANQLEHLAELFKDVLGTEAQTASAAD